MDPSNTLKIILLLSCFFITQLPFRIYIYHKCLFVSADIIPIFTPPQDILVSVCLTFTGLGETLSLPVGWRGGAGSGNPQFTLCMLSTLRLFCKNVIFSLQGLDKVRPLSYNHFHVAFAWPRLSVQNFLSQEAFNDESK